ncbi:hypothetical protein GLOIN_2v1776244 [Rhizophagus irregularis DAOM 181602=DAOM 197198]|nr:hypothetical protein GLOIN_2v1776244 [Rhizophagus irregularis DAOM 181602=DAOM 197198]
MNGNTNKSPTKETLTNLYEWLFYLEKNIIVIQDKRGIDGNANRAMACQKNVLEEKVQSIKILKKGKENYKQGLMK